ncbi:MAG: dTDP-glucose 4,6-dehydratase [Dehalococcoidia bacterium]|jgi:dTDP-glucose 4,6-dehydratase
MKTILVTGGAGFIGSNFVRYIFENYPDCRIIVLDALTYAGNIENIPENIKSDKRFTFWYGNVKNGELVSELVSKADTVVHFAAESHVARSIFDNTIFFETDVLGTQVVVNAALKYQDSIDRFVHISTSEVYGTALSVPMTEDHPLNPASPYAAAKAGADRLVYSYWVTYKVPAIIVRPFNMYGPNQHLEKAIPRFVTSALLDEPLTLHGSGENTRDWTYVTDLCVALDRVLQAPLDKVRGQVINIGNGRDVSVKDIANMVLGSLNKPASLLTTMSDRPGQVQRHIASTQKALDILGWKSEVSFEDGLAMTIDWYRQNRDWWMKQLWMRHVPIKTRDGRVEYH